MTLKRNLSTAGIAACLFVGAGSANAMMQSTVGWINTVFANAKYQSALKNDKVALMFCNLLVSSPPADPDPRWNPTTRHNYHHQCALMVNNHWETPVITIPF